MAASVGMKLSAPARAAVRSRGVAPTFRRQQICRPVRVIELDFTDPDTLQGAAGLVLGLVAGFGAPIWYINRVEKDQDRLEELRALNRANFEATGEYMNDKEISQLRKPKWTDRREWQDDD